jgi:hypothetical protein
MPSAQALKRAMTFTIKLSDVGSRNISYPVLDFRFWHEADSAFRAPSRV